MTSENTKWNVQLYDQQYKFTAQAFNRYFIKEKNNGEKFNPHSFSIGKSQSVIMRKLFMIKE